MSILAKCFEERIGGIIVCLPRKIDNCCCGASHKEEVERLAKKSVVEVPGTIYFGQACCNPFLMAHVDDGFVLSVN